MVWFLSDCTSFVQQLALAVKIQQGKFAPLPEHFSKELDRTIKCMLQVFLNLVNMRDEISMSNV
jgi:hypothetical protein